MVALSKFMFTIYISNKQISNAITKFIINVLFFN